MIMIPIPELSKIEIILLIVTLVVIGFIGYIPFSSEDPRLKFGREGEKSDAKKEYQTKFDLFFVKRRGVG